jgi:methionyl-tRNA formyltransferase
MKFTFFGSPKFAKIILEKLVDSGLVPDILICSPDSPIGRKKIITPPETKQFILDKKLKTRVFQPKNKEDLSDLKDSANLDDFAIVAAYSKIISLEVIKIFKMGVIGVHPSLLPKYRGPSPIQTALIDGKKETGVTLYMLDEKVDNGPILAQRNIDISDFDWNYEKLENKLAQMGGELLVETLSDFINKKTKLNEQDNTNATYTKKFITEDGLVNLKEDSPEIISRKIKALYPDPGAFAFINGKRTKLIEIIKSGDDFVITKIIPEGKKLQPSNIILK